MSRDVNRGSYAGIGLLGDKSTEGEAPQAERPRYRCPDGRVGLLASRAQAIALALQQEPIDEPGIVSLRTIDGGRREAAN